MRSFIVGSVVAAALLSVSLPLYGASSGGATKTVEPAVTEMQAVNEPSVRLVGAALVGGGAYAYTRDLSDRVGARLAGSQGAERAVGWALQAMQKAGLKNVHKEAVRVPRWVRGDESAELLLPTPHPLRVAALGNSVGTDPAGLTAEVVESSLTELKALAEKGAAPDKADKIKGRIVLLNQPMRRTSDFGGYQDAVPQRSRGAIAAARLGAVGLLIRSIGTGQHRMPHTGGMRVDNSVPRIPAAALAAEDADLLHRLLSAGERVRVRVRLGAHQEGEVESANVVGEIPGRELPDEVVLIGAHLDSWDLGAGALDDGAGCGVVLDTARSIVALGLRPRRTIRVVLFMNEELGLSGAFAYAEAHKNELARHVAALEADSGAGAPLGYRITGDERARALLAKWVEPLGQLVPTTLHSEDEVAADLIPLQAAGVPTLVVDQDMSDYFDWHHTAGDLIDKVSPRDLALVTAAFASLTYHAAESTSRLPPSPKPPRF
jgi:hypothetical protein